MPSNTSNDNDVDFNELDSEEASVILAKNIQAHFDDVNDFLFRDEVQDILNLDNSFEASPLLVELDEEGFVEKRPRPDTLKGITQCIETGHGKVYVTINEDPQTGKPFELFANTGRSGGFVNSFTEALAKSISIALRSGVNPRELADKLTGTRSPRVAWYKGEQVTSIPDAIGIALRRSINDEIHTSDSEQQNLDKSAPNEANISNPPVATDIQPEPTAKPVSTDSDKSPSDDAAQTIINAGENPQCPDCGGVSLYFSEGCKTCKVCGWSEC